MTYEQLEPKSVFKFFADISAIPRGSKNEKAISDYLVGFAKERGLWAHQDEYLNVIIRKPASAGYENAPTVILQGHMDMVCVKESGVAHDFLKDGIKLVIDGEYLRAGGTTLGADNGIAVAFCMALLDDNTLAHPPIEVLLTADEEAGMSGAANLDTKLLTGRRLINLDSEAEGEFFTSCAGGMTTHLYVPTEYTAAPAGYAPCALRVGGLLGGHSGGDIHMELGNANCLLSRALCALLGLDWHISEISGGAKENAIPREAEAALVIKEEDCERARAIIEKLCADIKQEYRLTDPGVTLGLTCLEKTPGRVYTKETSKKLAQVGSLLPSGITHMCMDSRFHGLVETSMNLGLVQADEQRVEFRCSVRSSVASRKYALEQRVKMVADALSAENVTSAQYPAWELDPGSWLQPFFKEQYKAFTGKEARLVAIHAGLECGWFAETMNKPDMISLGANCSGAHSPGEKMEIASVGRTWEFLKFALSNMKE